MKSVRLINPTNKEIPCLNLPLWIAGIAILASSFAGAAPDPKYSDHPTPAKAAKKTIVRKPQPNPAHKMTPGMKMPKS
jgi:hypothetical protein